MATHKIPRSLWCFGLAPDLTKAHVFDLIVLWFCFSICLAMPTTHDKSIRGYLTERTCWWNEVCKEEFQNQFRCKCPLWSFCRSPGRYYSAFCSINKTGYVWFQPERTWVEPLQSSQLAFTRTVNARPKTENDQNMVLQMVLYIVCFNCIGLTRLREDHNLHLLLSHIVDTVYPPELKTLALRLLDSITFDVPNVTSLKMITEKLKRSELKVMREFSNAEMRQYANNVLVYLKRAEIKFGLRGPNVVPDNNSTIS